MGGNSCRCLSQRVATLGSVGAALLILAGLLTWIVLVLYPETPLHGFYAITGRTSNNILFTRGDPSSYGDIVAILNDTLKPYHVTDGGNVIRCNDDTVLLDEQVCNFEADWLHGCTKDDFGYKTGHPCVLLTYKDDPSLIPEVYTHLSDIPNYAPAVLNESIHISYWSNENKLDPAVWVHCYCAYSYVPSREFSMRYFPNKELEAYLPPVMGVVFVLTDEMERNVECTLWSKTHDKMPERPKVSFTIQMKLLKQ